MARVTVEDCIERVPNRFELVMLAVQRARDLGNGSPLTVLRDSDKNPVIALREIAEERVSEETLWEALGAHFRMPVPAPEDEPLAQAEALFASGPAAETAETAEAAEATEATEAKEAAEGKAGEAEEKEPVTWSEEAMLKALQEMEGQSTTS